MTKLLPSHMVQIKDILIQGNNAQRLTALSESPVNPMTLSNREDIYTQIGYGKRIARYDNQLFLVNPDSENPVRLLNTSALHPEQITYLMDHFNHHLNLSESAPAPSFYKGSWDTTLNTICETLIKDIEVINTDYLNQVTELIQSIATLSRNHHEAGTVTRVITDEFTFYPQQQPFTLDEYKSIINRTADIAKILPPDIHLVLATFPVLWPDGGIHNCALHVESPIEPNANAIIHHFSKIKASDIDINYGRYHLTSDVNCSENQLPAVVLQNTAVTLNDPNQYDSAIKVNTSEGGELIVTMGICLEHSLGVERKSVHGLIEKLNEHHQTIPLHCSHVITSSSQSKNNEHILSTVSHADIMPHKRSPTRTGFVLDSVNSSFSGRLSAEIYPSKPIGTMHSDLFQHAVANQSSDDLAKKLNEQDSNGNTLLHDVFLETTSDRELIARRLYSMILNGGNPHKVNHNHETVRQLAQNIEQHERVKIITNAIDAAIGWQENVRKLNVPSFPNQRTLLTHELANLKEHTRESFYSTFNELIKNGSNPYKKDATDQSAIDIIDRYDISLRDKYRNGLIQSFQEVQYGYQRPEQNQLAGEEKPWFMPRIHSEITLLDQPRLEEAIQPYFLLLEKIESNSYTINDIYPAIYQIVEEIKSVFNESNNDARFMTNKYDIFSDIIMQKLSIRFPMSRDFIVQPERLLHTDKSNTALESLVFFCVKDRLIQSFQKLSDLKNISKFSPNERALIFEGLKDTLDSMPFNLNDIKILNALPSSEHALVFDKIKDRIRDKISCGYDLNCMKYLSPEEITFVFNTIKDDHQLITCTDDLEFLSYVSPDERLYIEEQIREILPNLFQSDNDLLELSHLSRETSSWVVEQIAESSRTLECTNNMHFLNVLMDYISSNTDKFIICCNALPKINNQIEPQYPLNTDKLMTHLRMLLNSLTSAKSVTTLKNQWSIIFNSCDLEVFEKEYQNTIKPILEKLSDSDRNDVVTHLSPAHQQVVFNPQKKIYEELQRLKNDSSNDENLTNSHSVTPQ